MLFRSTVYHNSRHFAKYTLLFKRLFIKSFMAYSIRRLLCPLAFIPVSLRKQGNHPVIIFRLMRKCTVCAVFYLSPVTFQIYRISRTILPCVQRTVTKQTVKLIKPLVAGKIPAFSVFKKSMGIFHLIISSVSFCVSLFITVLLPLLYALHRSS